MKTDLDSEILVIDDDIEVRAAICDVLEEEGYRVRAASNGADALRQLSVGQTPNLIVLDLTMPIMDGHEFLARRQQYPRLADIPIVIVSAAIDERVTKKDLALVSKPINLNVLLSSIRRALNV